MRDNSCAFCRSFSKARRDLCLHIPEIAQMEIYLNFVLVLCFIETVQLKRCNTIYHAVIHFIQTLRNTGLFKS